MKDKIYDIYTKYGDNMKTILLRVALDSISDSGTKYEAIDFFTKRAVISEDMQKKLNERLVSYLHTEVVFFQMRSIDLPDPYELSI